ncbi:hypothetical protein DQ04_02691090 [Trypanosoma grayi]|uniref:hypothetical protein n=1 Tax=Trypanosoma grayi TaxID=71804 RepID=UPI0004F49EC9|nr:hypothetical protein DQ04_02691090 [Trypanosoma grayi]KEG11376.1 hypothetical protein DQ04_02691090 [Trypanosoma grayi]
MTEFQSPAWRGTELARVEKSVNSIFRSELKHWDMGWGAACTTDASPRHALCGAPIVPRTLMCTAAEDEHLQPDDLTATSEPIL